MLTRIREMIGESWETYKKHFRPITSYLFFALLFGVLFFLLFLIPFSVVAFDNGVPLTILGYFLFVLIGAAGLYGAVRALAGFEFTLWQALQDKKIGTFKENFALAKPFTFRALGAGFLSGLFAYFPVGIGIGGIFALQPPSFFEALRLAELQQTPAPLPEIHGVWGYFFLFLALYGIVHLIYFSVLLSMSLYQVLFDKKSIKEALSSSAAMVRSRWWNVFGYILILQVILLFIYTIVHIPIDVIFKMYGEPAARIPDVILTLLMDFFISVPLLYLPMLLIYKDLKKKK